MNKIFNYFSFLFVSIVFIGITSCSDVVGGATVSDGSVNDGCVLSLSASKKTSDGTITKISNSSSRQINPTGLSDSDLKSFNLYGTSEKGGLVNQNFDITELVDGKYETVLAYDLWNLTLTAYDKAKTETTRNPILVGYKSADLTNGGTSVEFTLTAGDITETSGSISISGFFTEKDKSNPVVTKITASLTDYLTGTAVATCDTFTDVTTFELDVNGKGKFTFADTAVTPGTYYFMAKAYNDENKLIGNWGDLVIVAPGDTTTNVDDTNTDGFEMKLESAPNAPTDLKAFAINSSRTVNTYNLRLTWDESNIKNEEYFTINVYDYSSGTKTLYETLDKKFFESELRVSGSLLAGNSECVIKLPTGKLFDFEIAAVNFIDSSEYCTRVKSDSSTTETGFDIESDQRVNLVSIYYDLNGGTLYKASGNANKYTTCYTEWQVYSGDNIALLELQTPTETNTTPYPYCTNESGNPAQKWIKENPNVSASATTVTETDGFSNCKVFAYFNKTIIISYKIAGYEEMVPTRVTALFANSSAGPWDDDNSCKNAELEAKSEKYIRFEVATADTDETEYDDYIIKIDGVNYGYENDYVVSTVSLSSTTHVVTVLAKAKDTTNWYSNTFAITITR